MSRALPFKPHLDSLRKQARQLLRAHRSADPEAVERIRKYLPQLRHASEAAILREPFSLQTAQCVLAREYGFANWSELVKAVDIVRQAGPAIGMEYERLAAFSDEFQPRHALPPAPFPQSTGQGRPCPRYP